MMNPVYALLESIKSDYKKLSDKINTENTDNLNINLKHILEDIRSILDYIAVALFNKYCYKNKPNKKIYFPYCTEDKKENNYSEMIKKNFPGLYENHKNIYYILSNCQHYNDSTKWLIKLSVLTNEVKHNNLYIAKKKIENEYILSNSNNQLTSKGNFWVKGDTNGYEVFGTGEVYFSGTEQAFFYSNGDINIGNGHYNVITKEKNNMTLTHNKISILSSEHFDDDVMSILSNIITKTENLILKIQNYI